jgi:hypothetical protein
MAWGAGWGHLVWWPLLLWLWRRRSQARCSLSPLGHDAAEEVVGAVPEGRGRRLRRTRVLRGPADCGSTRVPAAGLQLTMKALDLLVVPVVGC